MDQEGREGGKNRTRRKEEKERKIGPPVAQDHGENTDRNGLQKKRRRVESRDSLHLESLSKAYPNEAPRREKARRKACKVRPYVSHSNR